MEQKPQERFLNFLHKTDLLSNVGFNAYPLSSDALNPLYFLPTDGKPYNFTLKVSKSRKQIMTLWILPKNETHLVS